MKMAEEANTMITEMEGTIFKASINNRMINATNILGISNAIWRTEHIKSKECWMMNWTHTKKEVINM